MKPDGFLIYSTCSIDPDENQGRVEAFLLRHPVRIFIYSPFAFVEMSDIDKLSLSGFTGVLRRSGRQICTIDFCNVARLLFIQPSETLLGWSICSSSGSSFMTLKASFSLPPKENSNSLDDREFRFHLSPWWDEEGKRNSFFLDRCRVYLFLFTCRDRFYL